MKLTFALDADYEVIRTQLTQNIVAVVEGSDPQLKSTYVALGAHYDHVGYAESELAEGKRVARLKGASTARIPTGEANAADPQILAAAWNEDCTLHLLDDAQGTRRLDA